MNAKEFIKKYGWEKAKEVLSKGLNMRSTYFDTKKHEFFDGTPVRKGIDVVRVSFLSDLKHLVDAWELVNRFGGLFESKKYIDDRILPELSRSIELVESVK